MTRPGSAQILDNNRAYITPGETVTEEGINVSGGGYLVLYRGDLSEFEELKMWKKCVKDAISKVVRYGSDEGVQVAKTWVDFLYSRTNKN
jgi:predicted type IV restriction endonuclease